MSFEALAQSHPVAAPRSWSWRSLAALLLPLIAVAGVGAAKGGFFATSFGWTGLAFAWATLIGVSLVAPRWGPLDVCWLGTAGSMCLFTFLSAVWAGSAGEAVNEGFRSLVYLTGVAGALVVLRRRDITRWLSGLVLGAAGVCAYGLATRIFPTHFSGFDSSDYRLFEPVGYWNALGIFAAIALLVALGVAALGRGAALRVLTATSAVVLAPACYFTFSRGAWFAVAAGAVVMFAFSPLRLRLISALILLGAAPAASVLLASHAPGLTHRGVTLASASHDGRRFALELLLLLVGQAAGAVVYVLALSRIEVAQPLRLAFAAVVVAVAIAALAGALAEYGSPITIARHGYDSFVSGSTTGTNLNGRLLSLSNNGRIVLWHAAWHEFSAHPAVGTGAGGFGRWWLAHRTTASFVEDAHNLYLETLAELGIAGFLLLVALLGVPLIAAVRARRSPLVAPALGGYVAFLVHAGVDWDWEVPAVTLLALFIGAALLAAARGDDPRPAPLGRPYRVAIGAAAAVAGMIALVGLIGNIALARSNSAVLNGNGSKAVAEAAKARSWAPWSVQALLDRGMGQIISGSKRSGLATLRQAAADDPGDWETWFEIAAATTGTEHRAALARAKALNPQSPEIADVVAAGG